MDINHEMDVQEIESAFIDALLFTLPDTKGNLSPELATRIFNDCNHFLSEASAVGEGDHCTGRLGHDFLMTRNGHGCGFWDGDWDEPSATLLTEIAEKFGPLEVYVGDDGLLYA